MNKEKNRLVNNGTWKFINFRLNIELSGKHVGDFTHKKGSK